MQMFGHGVQGSVTAGDFLETLRRLGATSRQSSPPPSVYNHMRDFMGIMIWVYMSSVFFESPLIVPYTRLMNIFFPLVITCRHDGDRKWSVNYARAEDPFCGLVFPQITHSLGHRCTWSTSSFEKKPFGFLQVSNPYQTIQSSPSSQLRSWP